MRCETLKKGIDCMFWKKQCTFNGGHCEPVVERCDGCGRMAKYEDLALCALVPDPAKKWSMGSCNFATHVKRDVAEENQKLNPLKASKRAASGK